MDEYDFIVGERVLAEFKYEDEFFDSLAENDIVYIGRENSVGLIDFSGDPYVAQCYSIWNSGLDLRSRTNRTSSNS